MKKSKLKNAWRFLKSEKKLIIILTILGIVFTGINTITPALFGNVIANISEGRYKAAIIIVIVIFIINIIYAIVDVFYDKLYYLTKNKIVFNIRSLLSSRVLDLETKEFDTKTTGLFITRMQEDPNTIVRAYNSIRLNFTEVFANIFVVAYIIYLNWIIGLVYTVALIFIIFMMNKGISIFIEKKKKYMDESEKTTTIFNEMIKGIRDIKLLNIKKTFIKKTNDSFERLNKKDYEHGMSYTKYYVFKRLVQQTTDVIVMILGIVLLANEKITLTTLLIIFMYRNNVFNSVSYLSWLKEAVEESNVSIERIMEVIDSKDFQKEKYGSKNLKNVKGKIEFKDVTFAYNKKNVINNLSLTIKPNETIAFVGKSGEGKTTLFNLITKSYTLINGQILIDDINVNDLTENSIKDNVSVINQNPYIFNMSFLENLKLINPKASKKEIIEKCKVAQIHDFIVSQPKGYDTIVGEGGVNLSGGQKQRMAIARALLKNSKILLMDEATSALDNETQNLILESIRLIEKEHTMIIIAHRLSTIQLCNKIAVIDKGQIINIGTHNNLLNECSLYKKLYKNEIIK